MLNVNAHAQWEQSDMIRFDYSDLTSGTGIVAKTIPAGYVITGGFVTVAQAFNSGTSAVLDLGDADDPNRYSSTSVDLAALGTTALDVTGYQYTAPTDFLLELTEVGAAATEGEAFVVLKLIREGKADTNL